MILNREQIDAIDRRDLVGESLIATMRAYHDLRGAVLALCDGRDGVDESTLRAVVARVERYES